MAKREVDYVSIWVWSIDYEKDIPLVDRLHLKIIFLE